jgi:hypothetical protein
VRPSVKPRFVQSVLYRIGRGAQENRPNAGTRSLGNSAAQIRASFEWRSGNPGLSARSNRLGDGQRRASKLGRAP